MKVIPATILTLVALTFPALTEETPKADPKAHALIDTLIEATGGKEAIEKIETRVVKGEMAMAAQGIAITMTVSQKAPNKVFVKQSVAGLMEATQGFDGEKGWSKDSILGFRLLEGAELEQLKRESNIRRELQLKEEYPIMKMLPDAEVAGKKAHVIEAQTADGKKETWFLDAETGLLSQMQQSMSLGAQGEIEVTILFGDYQEVDGIQIPMTAEIKNPAFNGKLKFTEVKHNVPLEETLFQVPAEDAPAKPEPEAAEEATEADV